MTKSARRLGITPDIVSEVEDDVIRPRRVTAYTPRDVIQAEIIACPPGDVVVGTRAVPADAYGSHEFAFAVIQRQSATEDIHPADFLPAHRVVVLSIMFGVAPVGNFGVNRIAVLQAEETSSWLHRGPQIGGGESQARQTEGIGRIGLLCGNHAASWPLVAPIIPGEGDRTDDPVAIDDRGPHVQIKAAVSSWWTADSGSESGS